MRKLLNWPWQALAILLLSCAAAHGFDLDDALLVLSKPVPKSTKDLSVIEAQVTKIAAEILPCTVGVQVGQNHGSGVVVSKDGYVLTAAHVATSPGRNARVLFSDGTAVRAKTLGMNTDADGALLKIIDPGEWPYARMVSLDDYPRPGDWCLATGHPGGFDPNRSPPIRLGRVIDVNKYLLRTDCAINSGDSGGPLFDLQGRVIGIHSRIAEQATVNLHGPVLEFRDTWEELKSSQIYPRLPSSRFLDELDVNHDGKISRAEQPDDVQRDVFDRIAEKYKLDKDKSYTLGEFKRKLGWRDVRPRIEIRPYELRPQRGRTLASERFVRGKQVRAAFQPLAEAASEHIVEVHCEGTAVALGTVVEGGILTKASELSDDIVVHTCDGQELPATVAGIDQQYDLALLQVNEELAPIRWAESNATEPGRWLLSPGVGGKLASVGVVSVLGRKIEGTSGVLGIQIDPEDRPNEVGARIVHVFEDSGAAAAGLKSDDVIVSVMGIPVRNIEELKAELKSHRPGEIVRAGVQRGGEKMEFQIRLGMPQDVFFNNERFGSGRLNGQLSQRRDDFPEALQHDSVLPPEACGGPVLNLQGQAIGINIARADRVASLALPGSVAQEVAQRLHAADTGQAADNTNP